MKYLGEWYSHRFQHGVSNQDHLSIHFEEKAVNIENLKLVEKINIEEELSQFKLPTPFEEVPVSEDKSEFHPAEFIDDIGPPLPISFNLAAYANHSETLIKLVQLGVDLSEMDKNPKKAKFILKLNFEKHIKSHVQFLHDNGVKDDVLGRVITRNPFIFQEDLENLEIRINYLKSKKFSFEAIARIITSNPRFLNMSTKNVDIRLGFFQKQFYLTGDEVRHVITGCPKLVSFKHRNILESIFALKEVCGFSSEEMKKLLIAKPKIYTLAADLLGKQFDIVHNVMKVPHERIVQHPSIFFRRTFMLKERHEYLVYLNRAQYDPTKPNYVSLDDIAICTDTVFCEKCAKTSVSKYNEFLKTR